VLLAFIYPLVRRAVRLVTGSASELPNDIEVMGPGGSVGSGSRLTSGSPRSGRTADRSGWRPSRSKGASPPAPGGRARRSGPPPGTAPGSPGGGHASQPFEPPGPVSACTGPA
jgi:hypothetical protein